MVIDIFIVMSCDRWIGRRSRTHDQMVQAARSGKQNIAEGSMASGTSKKTELKLVGVVRASLEELLLDYHDFLRQRHLSLWAKNHLQAQQIRKLAYASDRSHTTYRTYIEGDLPEVAANTLICLIYQTNYLLDQKLGNWKNSFCSKAASPKSAIRQALKPGSDHEKRQMHRCHCRRPRTARRRHRMSCKD